MRTRAPDYVRKGTPFVNPRRAKGLLVRGYVTAVYAADDSSAPNSPAANGEPEEIGSVLCDVTVVEPGFRGMLTNVPVLSPAGGLHSVAHWTPQEATKLADTGIPAVNLSDGGPLPTTTRPEQTDADLVIVGFLGDDLSRPVIVGSLLKPNSNHAVTKANLGTYAWVHHGAGAVVGVEAGGRVVIDTASQPLAVTPGDDEIVITTGGAGGADGTTITVSGGDVTISTGLSGKVSIDGNAVGAPFGQQPVVLADALSDLVTLLTEWYPIIQAVAGMFGIPLSQSTAIIAALSVGATTAGTATTSHSLETD